MRILPLLCLLLSGCAVQLEAGAGVNDRLFAVAGAENKHWDGSNTAAAYLGVRAERKFSDRVDGFCKYAHYSQWSRSWPVNDRSEDWLDHVGCGVSVRIFGERQ